MADLAHVGEWITVARSGGGGKGNANFASPTSQFPLLAEAGDPSEELDLKLKLKLLADVGIIGAPNAGKSSLLAAVSAARPRIAAYPFTTIEPVLGTMLHRGVELVLVDVPGLVEGAHKGVGLGHQFLRHIERTSVVIHVIDGSGDDIVGEYRRTRGELAQFEGELAKKPEIIAVNKVDLPGVAERFSSVKGRLEQESQAVHCISAVARLGLDALLNDTVRVLGDRRRRQEEPEISELPVLRPGQQGKSEVVRRDGDAYVVVSRRAVRLAELVEGSNWGARMQLYERMRRFGVIAALEKAGIKQGEVFRVGSLEWEWD
jgi:GTP-binding protein